MRRTMLALGAMLLTLAAAPGAHAQDVPAYGVITITDPGTGPRATWTYEGAFTCRVETEAIGGVPTSVTVRCFPTTEGGVTFACPLMVVSRTTPTVVGARAWCSRVLDMGVGTTGTASANLGRVLSEIRCEAYVETGVLVPPYTVSCNEPGLPGAPPLASVPTGTGVR